MPGYFRAQRDLTRVWPSADAGPLSSESSSPFSLVQKDVQGRQMGEEPVLAYVEVLRAVGIAAR
jgi:hypothetical protein